MGWQKEKGQNTQSQGRLYLRVERKTKGLQVLENAVCKTETERQDDSGYLL